MSHHPTTAELAAFRRNMMPESYWAACEHGWRDMSGQIVPANGTMKRWGCPVQNGRDHISVIARREASAMRHRAYYARLRGESRHPAPFWPLLDMIGRDGSYFSPWTEEYAVGVPYTFHPGYTDR